MEPAQLRNKLYAMHPDKIGEFIASRAAMPTGGKTTSGKSRVSVVDGVGILDISGPLSRYSDFWTRAYGEPTFEELIPALQSLASDPKVKSIVLDINSPGGEVDGTSEFADMVYAIRGQKPISAYVSGLGASAAYWIASQADRIVMNDTAEVGSIGVVSTYADPTEFYKSMGFTIHQFVSSQSPMKRPDMNSEDGRAEIQKTIDKLAEIFIGRVSRGRGVSEGEIISNFGRGGTRIGADAVSNKMADKIGKMSDAVGPVRGEMMTLEILQKEHGGLLAEIQSKAKAEVTAGHDAALSAAREDGITAERARIKAIDDEGFEAAIAADAKYANPCTAEVAGSRAWKAQEASRKKIAEDLKTDAASIPGNLRGEALETGTETNPVLEAMKRLHGEKK